MSDMNPPKMAAWNLGLRLGLEVTALVAIGALAWGATGGALRWFAVVAAPLVAATLWGLFNVKDDPQEKVNLADRLGQIVYRLRGLQERKEAAGFRPAPQPAGPGR